MRFHSTPTGTKFFIAVKPAGITAVTTRSTRNADLAIAIGLGTVAALLTARASFAPAHDVFVIAGFAHKNPFTSL